MSENSLAKTLMAIHASSDTNEPSLAVDSETQRSPSSSSASQLPQQEQKKFDIRSLDAFPTLAAKQPSTSTNGSGGLGVLGRGSTFPSPSNRSGSASPRNGSSPTLDVTAPVAARSGAITDVFTLRADQQASNAKAIISEVVLKVRKATNTSVESSTSKASGHITFIVKGLPENVRRAKRDILRDLSQKVTKKMQIPASTRAAIIGPRGSTLRPIIERSGASIQVGKRSDEQHDSTAEVDKTDDDEEELVDVVLEGDEEGVGLAIAEINSIVNSKVREITSKIQGIDVKLLPFVQKDILSYKGDRDVKINITDFVSIFGERAAVLDVRARIENALRGMSVNYGTAYLPLPRVKHKFVDTGRVMKETGVSVTPLTSGTETLELFGPKGNLESAKALVKSLTQDIKVLTLDISKAHDKSISHARNITNFFKKTGKLQEIEKSHNVVITVPSFGDLYADNVSSIVFEVTGTDSDKIKEAKKNLVSLVNNYGPGRVMVIEDLDPFFHGTISRSGILKNIKQEDQVEVVLPHDPKISRQVLLVYDEKNDEDDFAPGADEIARTLANANAKFDEIREKQRNIVSKIISVPQEKHKYIIGPGGTTLHAITKGSSKSDPLVAVIIGIPKPHLVDDVSKFDASSIWVRGLKSEVDRIITEINRVVEESDNYEAFSNYTTEFTFPIEHLNKLIGKQGSNVGKLREEFGVKIEVDESGNGTIKGFKKNAEQAKTKIVAMGERLADEATVRLKIAAEYHPTLIGQGGKFVRRLKDKYDVLIRFPKTSLADGEEDPDQLKKDEVLIRGPSKGVSKTKEEMLDLVKYEVEHSHTETIMVPANALPRIIGRQGEYINEIKDETNTRINVLDENISPSLSKDEKAKLQVGIELVGTKNGVKSAASRIQDIVKEFKDIVEESIDVDPKYHALIIGSGGQTRRDIIAKACGSAEAPEINQSRTIQVPPAGSKSSIIKVYGNKRMVIKIVKTIKDMASEREKLITDSVEVPVETHRALVGPGGLTKQQLETEFNVSINIPKRGSTDPEGNPDKKVQVTGESQAVVDQVKERILEMSKNAYVEEVQVDRTLHSDLNARLSKKLANEYDLRVDFGGRNTRSPAIQAPKEAFGDFSLAPADGGSLNYKFHVVPDSGAKEPTKPVVWKLRGNPEDCAKGRRLIEATVKDLEQHDATGFLWLADPSKYGAVIGPQGNRVNKIRQVSKCTITVPRADAGTNEVIKLRGTTVQLEVAKKMILEAVAKH